MNKLKLLFILIIILVVSRLSLVVSSFAGTARYIRVAILQNAASLRLEIKGPYEVLDPAENKVLNRGKNLNTTLTSYSTGISLGDIKSRTNKLFIKADKADAVMINGRMFRGNMQFIKDDYAKLTAINYIDLEDYIKGISVRETSHYRPIESLKAEVIVFRTFALYKMQENSKNDFDLTSDVYSQVYGGRGAERYRINKAVDETAGMVLTYKDKILPAFYHATCGGHTEDASLLWNINIGPLKGLPCNFCRESPHFSWHSVLARKDLKDTLLKSGYKLGDIEDILILGYDKSSRITDLKIISDKKEIKISAKDFRNIAGPDIIRSTNFQVKVLDDDIVFEGLGWGHGVGLCQWGAYFMAKEGYDYKKILEYYYPGAQISSVDNLK
ncbi:MAG: SpoIID/LytB domain-containing protein [Candidatus Omnitrophica bacterium]|nr:SpoIID/LytB domain-containing protein [Candidatus Omnitrophota bacterium]